MVQADVVIPAIILSHCAAAVSVERGVVARQNRYASRALGSGERGPADPAMNPNLRPHERRSNYPVIPAEAGIHNL
jgi:hypothetical protein